MVWGWGHPRSHSRGRLLWPYHSLTPYSLQPPEDAFTDEEEDEPPAPVKKQAAVVIEEVPAATEA